MQKAQQIQDKCRREPSSQGRLLGAHKPTIHLFIELIIDALEQEHIRSGRRRLCGYKHAGTSRYLAMYARKILRSNALNARRRHDLPRRAGRKRSPQHFLHQRFFVHLLEKKENKGVNKQYQDISNDDIFAI